MSNGRAGCVAKDARLPNKGPRRIESHPTAAQIVRLGGRSVMHDWTRIADRHDIVFPVVGESLDARDHLSRRHRRSGLDFVLLLFAVGENLDVGAADVDGQDIHGNASIEFWLALASTGSWPK
jgi:hypothetical protein